MSFAAIYITHANELSAKKISSYLIDKKLVACANIFPVTSAYWWKGHVQHEGEFVSLVKTIPENWEAVKLAVETVHPYEVPCIIKFDVEANAKYEEWIRDSVEKASEQS